MRLLSATVALLLSLAACSSDGSSTPGSDSAAGEATTTTTTTTVVASDGGTEADAPQSLALADPVKAADPSAVELDEDITIDTTVFSLVLEPGTDGELPLHIAVPTGWSWDADSTSFRSGDASLRLETGCSNGCQTTAWEVVLTQDGELLADPFADLEAGGSEGFSSASGLGGGTLSRSRTFDDGSGRSVTALFHHRAGRWLGCTADTTSATDVPLEILGDLCESIAADWTTVIANTTVSTIEETVTDSVAAILDKPTINQPLQVVPLDEEGEHNVSMQVPADTTVDVDGFFGTELMLGGDYSIFTDIELNASCDGICEAQDWGSKLNSTDGELGRTRASIEPQNDTPIDAGWLLSGPNLDDDGATVLVVRWDDTARRYFSCTIEIDESDVDRSDELLTICLTAEPLWFG